ncbi:sperm microtubule inner protein 11 [Hyperolius riggenbachi]|uniref:sperm microtubule inner protein 11 n=1 Tax=Hyperolius riggenbachi TaxID=752182 RepID=UPI0035A38ED7
MAFFGLTTLGYQAPLRAARIQELGDIPGEKGKKSTKLPPLVPQTPHVSYGKYKETVRRHQDLHTPKETQRVPLTTAQQYGWWLPQEPRENPQTLYPWIQSTRYPMINSAMTRFVDQMAVTNKEFSLF